MLRGREVGFNGVPYAGSVLKEVMVVRDGVVFIYLFYLVKFQIYIIMIQGDNNVI